MTQKKALKIVGILLVSSVLILIVHAVLLRAYPEKFDRKVRQNIENKQEVSEMVMDELPIRQTPISQTDKNNQNVFSWPYDSSVPLYHQVDLSIYTDKIKDAKALEGITIYLGMSGFNAAEQKTPREISENLESSGKDDLSDNSNQYENVDLEDNAVLNSDLSEQDYQKILNHILEETKSSLEAIGAKVIVVDSKFDDLQKAAFIGENILQDFITELSEQNFKSDTLQSLLEPLADVQHSSDNQMFFADIGVSSQHRLLLDVERQYSDRLYLNFRWGETENSQSGSLIRYFGNQSGAIGAQSETLKDDSAEKPAYIAYDTDNRIRLADLTNKSINQLLPALNKDLEDGVKEDIVPVLRLVNVNSLDIAIGQKGQVFDMQILTSEEQQKVLAEAISNACYEFYCMGRN